MNKRLIYFLILTVALTIGFAATGVISFADEPAAANAAVKVEVTKGIVNASKLNLRSNPGTNFAIVGQLKMCIRDSRIGRRRTGGYRQRRG